MTKSIGLHRHICRRFFQKVVPAVPGLAFCDVCFKRWREADTALTITVPNEDIGMLLWKNERIIQSAARELGIATILMFRQSGSPFGPVMDCRQESDRT